LVWGRAQSAAIVTRDLPTPYVRVAGAGWHAEIFNVNDRSRLTVLEMAARGTSGRL